MQTIEERTIDKSTWQRGPWDAEPDKKQWIDQDTGLPCLIVRHPSSGHLCGYVGVSSGHPLYEKEYSDRIAVPSRDEITNTSEAKPWIAWLGEVWREDDGTVSVEALLDVHGGITFAAKCDGRICHKVEPGEDDNVWWFGFDCAHAGDRSSLSVEWGRWGYTDECYRDFDYVTSECAKLAKQLVAMAAPAK